MLAKYCSQADKYGLDQMFYNSFNCSFGFRHKFCAADIVRVREKEQRRMRRRYCQGKRGGAADIVRARRGGAAAARAQI